MSNKDREKQDDPHKRDQFIHSPSYLMSGVTAAPPSTYVGTKKLSGGSCTPIYPPGKPTEETFKQPGNVGKRIHKAYCTLTVGVMIYDAIWTMAVHRVENYRFLDPEGTYRLYYGKAYPMGSITVRMENVLEKYFEEFKKWTEEIEKGVT